MNEDVWLFKGWCQCRQPYECTLPVGDWPGLRFKCDDCGTSVVWGNPHPINGRLGFVRTAKTPAT